MTRAQLVLNRARQLQESGIKDWGECINQAYAEIPPDASRTASIANDASRQAILGRKNAARDEFIRAVHSDMEKTGKAYQDAYAWAAKTHATLFNDMNLIVPPPLEKTSGGTNYSDGRGYPAPGSSAMLPTPPWLKLLCGAATNETNGEGCSWFEIQRLNLPVDCHPDELAAAQAANTTDPAKLFDHLVSWIGQTKQFNFDSAQAFAAGRFSKLIHRGAKLIAPKMGGAPQQFNPPAPGQS